MQYFYKIVLISCFLSRYKIFFQLNMMTNNPVLCGSYIIGSGALFNPLSLSEI